MKIKYIYVLLIASWGFQASTAQNNPQSNLDEGGQTVFTKEITSEERDQANQKLSRAYGKIVLRERLYVPMNTPPKSQKRPFHCSC